MIDYLQVKPLLQVTNNEEKLNAKENELKAVTDKFEKTKHDLEELEKVQKTLAEEKTALFEQLQAEQEACAEAEEVITTWCLIALLFLLCTAL